MATSKALSTTQRSPARATPAVIDQAALVIHGVPTVEQVKQVLSEGSKFFVDEESVSNTGSFLTSVLDRATSASDLFAESELLNMKEHLGEVFVLEGIDAVRPSDYDEEGSLGVYLIVSAVDSEGELVKLAVGSRDPFAKIVALHELDAFPWRVSFEKAAKATKRGFFPVNLVNRQTVNKSGSKVDF